MTLASLPLSLKEQGSFDAASFRHKIVPLLQDHLDKGLVEAESVLIREKDGLKTAQALASVMDEILATIFESITFCLYMPSVAVKAEKLCIVATGGYGRGTLAPGSDIDLLFLTPYKTTPWAESVVETVLYILWDLKLKVGHATRSVEECLNAAREDVTIRTSLLETRFLSGDNSLLQELTDRFDTEIIAKSASEFVEAKLRERENRITKAGQSRYLVEPNVKDGKGGLRDLNTLFWIAKYVYQVREAHELVEAGLFTAREWRLFQSCEEFLWRVRWHLHLVTGRAEERLSFDVQKQVAERMGYVGRGHFSATERFMKAYFLTAKSVGDLTAIVCADLEARQAKQKPLLNRMFGHFRRSLHVREADFHLDHDRLALRSDHGFSSDPVNLIRLFWLADQYGWAIHPDTSRLANRSLRLITPEIRENAVANKLFLDILTSKHSPETTLRRMSEAGVLGRFVPEFGRVVAMMQFSMYHHYTVDEHLLRSVGILSEIENGHLHEEHPLASEIIRAIQNRRTLYVAMFLHDIAKGRNEDHSIAGARIAKKLCPRFGLSAAETDTVAWLIEYHLLMSTIAQTRDLSDPRTIEAFAKVVQSRERLKLLLILTVADIKAVGPSAWTGWKGELLRTLYYETEMVLGGTAPGLARSERVKIAHMRLREELSDWTSEEFEAYAARHYPAYWLRTDSQRQLKHVKLLRRNLSDMMTSYETDTFRAITEITIAAPDHPRLLAIITGACAAMGGNIVDAQIFTTVDGMALDTIALSRAFDHDEDELRRAERITKAMVQALKGEIKISDLVASRKKQAEKTKTFTLPFDVTIDNEVSSRHTVIEISGLDRPGLLYELTTALGRLNLNIASAHITTYGEKAVDVFYVTDLTGSKITVTSRQNALRRALLEVLERDHESAV
jgi:[protein-PII] uridylyltransferase